MKYITTDTHPCYKPGIILHTDESGNLADDSLYCIIYKGAIDTNIKYEHIKELQEPEFTKDDVFSFHHFVKNSTILTTDDEYFNEWIEYNDWLKLGSK